MRGLDIKNKEFEKCELFQLGLLNGNYEWRSDNADIFLSCICEYSIDNFINLLSKVCKY